MHAENSHGSSRNWARAQAVSGLIFLAFALVHLTNTALAALGPRAYDGFQAYVRPVYQHPLLELTLVLGPVAVHIAAAIARMRKRRGSTAKAPLRLRLHRYAGWFLMLVIVGHVVATRGPAIARGIHPDFTGVAWTFVAVPAYFYPYYTVFGIAGLLHAFVGTTLALAILGVSLPSWLRAGPRLWVPVGALASLVVLGVFGLGGLLFDVPDPAQSAFARFGMEVLARFAR